MNSFSPDFLSEESVGLERVCALCVFSPGFQGEAEDSVLGVGEMNRCTQVRCEEEQDWPAGPQPIVVRDREAVAEMRLF